MSRLEKMINNTIVLLDKLAVTFDFNAKKTRSKPQLSDSDRKLDIAINTAQEIINRYEYVAHINRVAYLDDGDIRFELKALGNTDLPPLRPRYKYWTDFNPEVGIEVLHTLEKYVNRVGEYLRDRINRLIEKLEVILKPFRVQPVETIAAPSLGLRRYKFSPYAQWVQSFPDHHIPYALWMECGLYDDSEPEQDIDKFFRLIRLIPSAS